MNVDDLEGLSPGAPLRLSSDTLVVSVVKACLEVSSLLGHAT